MSRNQMVPVHEVRPVLEDLEQRLLLTTLTGGQTFTFTDLAGEQTTLGLVGNITVDIKAAFDSGGILSTGDPVLVPLPPRPGDLIPMDFTDPTPMDLFRIEVQSGDSNSGIYVYSNGDPYAPSSFVLENVNLIDGSVGTVGMTGVGSAYLGARVVTASGWTPVTKIGDLQGGLFVDGTNDLGNFFFGGIVTGVVDAGGSIGQFYCGMLLSGKTDGVVGFRNPVTNRINPPPVTDNFHVAGDVYRLVSATSIGAAPGATAATLTYWTGADIVIGGKLGEMHAGLASFDTVVDADIVGFIDVGGNVPVGARLVMPQVEWEGVVANGLTDLENFELFHLTIVGSTNNLPRDAQVLGTDFAATPSDDIHIQGFLDHGALDAANADNVDYYGTALMAGQTITAQLRTRDVIYLAPKGTLEVGDRFRITIRDLQDNILLQTWFTSDTSQWASWCVSLADFLQTGLAGTGITALPVGDLDSTTLVPSAIMPDGVKLVTGRLGDHIQVDVTTVESNGLPADFQSVDVIRENIYLGLFDPDDRLVATDFSRLDDAWGSTQPVQGVLPSQGQQVRGAEFQLTTDRPGLFRFAIGRPDDPTAGIRQPWDKVASTTEEASRPFNNDTNFGISLTTPLGNSETFQYYFNTTVTGTGDGVQTTFTGVLPSWANPGSDLLILAGEQSARAAAQPTTIGGLIYTIFGDVAGATSQVDYAARTFTITFRGPAPAGVKVFLAGATNAPPMATASVGDGVQRTFAGVLPFWATPGNLLILAGEQSAHDAAQPTTIGGLTYTILGDVAADATSQVNFATRTFTITFKDPVPAGVEVSFANAITPPKADIGVGDGIQTTFTGALPTWATPTNSLFSAGSQSARDASQPTTPGGSTYAILGDVDAIATSQVDYVARTFTITFKDPVPAGVEVFLTGPLALQGPPTSQQDYELIIKDVGYTSVGNIDVNGDVLSEISVHNGNLGRVQTNQGDIAPPLDPNTKIRIDVENGDLKCFVSWTSLFADVFVVNGNAGLVRCGGETAPAGPQNPTDWGTTAPTFQYHAFWNAYALAPMVADMYLNISVTVDDPATQVGKGNIQLIDAARDLRLNLLSDGATGVIRVGRDLASGGTIYVGHDDSGRNGFLDLLDVGRDMYYPRISHGVGGDIRYIRVGGTIFSVDGASQSFLSLPVGQSLTYRDDSGISVTLTPWSKLVNAADFQHGEQVLNPVTGLPIEPGTIEYLPYEICDGSTGFVVGMAMVAVRTDSSIVITSNNNGIGGEADIGQVIVLDPTENQRMVMRGPNGVPVLAPEADAALTLKGQERLSGIKIVGNAKVNVLDVLGLVGSGTGIMGKALTYYRNATGGETVNMLVKSIAEITTAGSLGVPSRSSTGALVNPRYNQVELLAPAAMTVEQENRLFGSVFPYYQQRLGVVAIDSGSKADMVNVLVGGSVGNFYLQGSIGNLVANYGRAINLADGTFRGIAAPIYVMGNLWNVNVGEGLAPSGNSDISMAGLYAAGDIVRVVNGGAGSDIRGNIVASGSIQHVFVTNGSIIGSAILAGIPLDASRQATMVKPSSASLTSGSSIGGITQTGKGGIIGSVIGSFSVGNVRADGFGILSSYLFADLQHGSIGTITAGGFGLRNVRLDSDQGRIMATGAGGKALAPASLCFFATALPSTTGGYDPVFHQAASAYTDVALAVSDKRGGIIHDIACKGIGSLGTRRVGSVSAWWIDASSFGYGNLIVGMNSRAPIPSSDIVIYAGELTTASFGGSLSNSIVSVSGKIGTFSVWGDFTAGSWIQAIGQTGWIGTVGIHGNMQGGIRCSGYIGSITVTGDYTGSLRAEQPAGVWAAISSLRVTGNLSLEELDMRTTSTGKPMGKISSMYVGGRLTGDPAKQFVIGDIDTLFVGGGIVDLNLKVGSVRSATVGGMTDTYLQTASIGTFSAGSVNDTTITVAGGIGTLTALEWLDTDPTPDSIIASWIGTLNITGRRATKVLPLIAGDFQADMTLSGVGAPRNRVLGTVNIKGAVSGDWTLTAGATGLINIGSTTDTFSLTTHGQVAGINSAGGIEGALSALYFDKIAAKGLVTATVTATGAAPTTGKGIGTFSAGSVNDTTITVAGGIGTLTALEWLDTDPTPDSIIASWIGTLNITGRRATKVLPLIAGDFQADMTLSGVGAPRNRVLGTVMIAHDVTGSTWKITGSAGALNIKGTATDSMVRASGTIDTLNLGATDGSEFQAGVTVEKLAADIRIADVDDLAAIKTINVHGWYVAPGQPKQFFVKDSSFLAGQMGRVILTNAEGMSSFTIYVPDPTTDVVSVRYTDTVTRANSWIWPSAKWVGPDPVTPIAS